MSFSQYEALIKTIELGSLTRAAESLGYTQSGISHMLNSLENELGVKLLIRDRMGIRITSDGIQLLPYFHSVCSSQYTLNTKVQELQRLECGLVRVGTFTSVSGQWLPGILKKFRDDFPKIQFELLHGTNKDNEEWLVSGRIDCAFIRQPTDQNYVSIFLRKDPILAILPKHHELAGKTKFPVSALSKYPYIRLDDGINDEMSEIFEKTHITPATQFVVKDDYAIIAMVDSGLGISILPELMLKNSMLKVVRKPLDVPAYRNIAIAFKNQKSLSAITQRFMEYAQLWVQEEYGE